MVKNVMARLREPSTHAALASITAATGLVPAEQQAMVGVALSDTSQLVCLILSGIFTFLGAYLREQASRK